MLKDNFGRKIEYLRISLTDRCNLRCIYCMPPTGIKNIGHNNILRYEEIERIVGIFNRLGVHKFRFTGGEPLIRRGVLDFLKKMEKYNIYLTTNLSIPNLDIERLNNIKFGGINVSCDSLKPERYNYITRHGNLECFLNNFKKLKHPNIKINVVLMRGFNEDEITDFIDFAVLHNVTVRFIEKMDFNVESSSFRGMKNEIGYTSLSSIKDKLVHKGVIAKEALIEKNSVARYHKLTNMQGKVGFITHLSNPFCTSCNRLRIKANGKIKLCLFDKDDYDLKALLRSEQDDTVIIKWILDIIKRKHLHPLRKKSHETAAEIGG